MGGYASTGANTDNNDETAVSASVAYKGGPLYVALAYEKHDSNILSAAAGNEDETGMRLVGSGTFGMFKVVALYQQLADVNGAAGADRSTWGLGGAVTLAEKHVIKAQYYNADPTDGVATDDGATMYALGYDYKLSKKTTTYVSYAMTSNDPNASFTVNAGGHGDTFSTSGRAAKYRVSLLDSSNSVVDQVDCLGYSPVILEAFHAAGNYTLRIPP